MAYQRTKNEVDNVLRSINRRLQSFQKTFGVESEEYQTEKRRLRANKTLNRFVAEDKTGAVRIKRTNESIDFFRATAPNYLKDFWETRGEDRATARQRIVNEIKKSNPSEKITPDLIRETAKEIHRIKTESDNVTYADLKELSEMDSDFQKDFNNLYGAKSMSEQDSIFDSAVEVYKSKKGLIFNAKEFLERRK